MTRRPWSLLDLVLPVGLAVAAALSWVASRPAAVRSRLTRRITQ